MSRTEESTRVDLEAWTPTATGIRDRIREARDEGLLWGALGGALVMFACMAISMRWP